MADVAHAVTVRVIRSFEYRNIHNLLYHDVDLNQTATVFLLKVKEGNNPSKTVRIG